MTLPVEPVGRLRDIFAAISAEESELLAAHLLGGVSADWLAAVLTSEGHQVSASTIRGYRRALKMHDEESVQV